MATVLIATVGITGRTNTIREMASRLRARGHDVAVASTERRAADRLAGSDVTFEQLDAGVSQELRERLVQAPAGRLARWRHRREARTAIAKARGAAALEGYGIDTVIERHAPALILVESELHDTILYLLSQGIAPTLLEYHVSTRRAPGVPPLASPAIPDGGALSRVRASLAWMRLRLRRELRHIYNRWYFHAWDHRSIWRRLAAQGGGPLVAVARQDQWPMLHYPSLDCLHLCASELNFSHEVTDSGVYVGPIVQASRADPPGDADAEACRALLAARGETTRPLVACAMGSILSLPAFQRKMIAAVRGADFDLVLAISRRMNPEDLGEVPDNVHVFRYIPQLDVLRHADLFVCHGGIGTLHECVMAGVPMLVHSGGQLDENGNAARVEYHGLGRRGRLDDGPEAVRANIDALLGDPAYRHQVAAMREHFRRYRQDGRFDSEIERQLQPKR